MAVAVKTPLVPIQEKVADAVRLIDSQGIWEKADKGDWAHPMVTPAKPDGLELHKHVISRCLQCQRASTGSSLVKMPLGLKDSATIFQWAIHETRQDHPGAVPSISNILVYGKTKQEHDHNLQKVLLALHSRSRNFWLQLSKCRFRQATIAYLGLILSGSELQPKPGMLVAILNAPVPQISSFLGLVSWYSGFVTARQSTFVPLAGRDLRLRCCLPGSL